jgi:hypothetical protein
VVHAASKPAPDATPAFEKTMVQPSHKGPASGSGSADLDV